MFSLCLWSSRAWSQLEFLSAKFLFCYGGGVSPHYNWWRSWVSSMDLIRPDSRWSWFRWNWFLAGTVWVLLFPGVWICLFDCFDAFLWFPEFVCCAENTLVESPWFGLKWLNEWRIGAVCVWIVELHGDNWIGLVYWWMIRVIVKSPCFVVLSAPGGRLDKSIRFVLGEDRGSNSSVCGFSLISSLHHFSLAGCHSRVLFVSFVWYPFLRLFSFFSFPFFFFLFVNRCVHS